MYLNFHNQDSKIKNLNLYSILNIFHCFLPKSETLSCFQHILLYLKIKLFSRGHNSQKITWNNSDKQLLYDQKMNINHILFLWDKG